MRSRLLVLGILGASAAFGAMFSACAGDSNTADGGPDATTDVTVADQKTNDSPSESGNDGGVDAAPDVKTFPYPCSADGGDAAALQTFTGNMFGCGGAVTFPSRATLCGASCSPCSAAQWIALNQGTAPTHQYWTDDTLGFAGKGPPNDCFAGNLVDGGVLSACSPSTDPMRVCIDGPFNFDGGDAAFYPFTSIDSDNNACNWNHCGFLDGGADAAPDASTSLHFGGCNNDDTAGTLCCCN